MPNALILLSVLGVIAASLFFSPQLRAHAMREVFDAAWWGYTHHVLPGDFRMLSESVHKSGMALVTWGIPFKDAINLCTTHFRGGCIHGVVMQETRSLKEPAPETFHELCGSLVNEDTADDSAYFDCVHGAGHVLMMENETPQKAILGCSVFLLAYQSSCTSGVFMEYLAPPKAHDAHDMKSMTRVEKAFDCNMINAPFKDDCYISEGFYRHYPPDTNDFEGSVAYCQGFGAEGAALCVKGVRSAEAAIKTPR